ncbi:hypothetical protein Zmor_018959 [Zophobas morio]|uniref:Uncharacterized protein n=1 Tax=Zophobas morio TaxID=2755281 RepID=A0AA38ID94_9CUCU|nr:hypothetical protein Zmor_018959 [Zophobas morio]
MQPPDWQLQRASPKRKRHGGNVKQTLFFSDHSPGADDPLLLRPLTGCRRPSSSPTTHRVQTSSSLQDLHVDIHIQPWAVLSFL